MYMDKDHPLFDIVLELQACLPTEPTRVPLAHLQDDFGLSRQSDVRAILDQAALRGYGTTIGNLPGPNGGRAVGLTTSTSQETREAADAYLRQVYGLASVVG